MFNFWTDVYIQARFFKCYVTSVSRPCRDPNKQKGFVGKYLKDNKHNNLHLASKTSTSGHYLFLEAHRFPRASVSENCSVLGRVHVRWQISVPVLSEASEAYFMNKRRKMLVINPTVKSMYHKLRSFLCDQDLVDYPDNFLESMSISIRRLVR